ncbi:MAG: NAD-dependent malic enzyme, partial [Candidatus Deferrimicrobiaceae bacterium]
MSRNGKEDADGENHSEREHYGLKLRLKNQGLVGVESKVPIRDASALSLLYTPGVAAPCLE